MTKEEIKEKMEEIDFRIIASVGTARSMYIEALECAKQGNFKEAHAKIAEADTIYAGGHDAHQDLLQLQGEGEEMPFDLLLVHAEDQMMSAECFKVMVIELIEIYEKALRASRES